MDDPQQAEGLWSTARADDLRRIADMARRLFAAPAVAIVSGDDRIRHLSGDAALAQDALAHDALAHDALAHDALAHAVATGAAPPVRETPLVIESGERIGSLRVFGERNWSDGDRATMDDVAACLCSLIESRHAAAPPEAAAPAVAPPFHADDVLHDVAPRGDDLGDSLADDGVAPASEPGSRILLADDLDLNRKLISDMLALDGHAVDSVSDGEAAVQAAVEHSYDLILMDMIMPVMDGMAATRAIRALPSPACDVPIVALTAYSLPDQLDNCMKAGVDAVLTKPMSVAALNEAIATWSGRRRAA